MEETEKENVSTLVAVRFEFRVREINFLAKDSSIMRYWLVLDSASE